MIMNIILYKLMQRMEEKKGRTKNHLPEDHRNSKEVRDLTRITRLSNVIHVISWDTLRDIVHLINTSSRRRNEKSMPMQLKRMNQMKKRIEKMKTIVKSMY